MRVIRRCTSRLRQVRGLTIRVSTRSAIKFEPRDILLMPSLGFKCPADLEWATVQIQTVNKRVVPSLCGADGQNQCFFVGRGPLLLTMIGYCSVTNRCVTLAGYHVLLKSGSSRRPSSCPFSMQKGLVSGLRQMSSFVVG